MIAHLVSDRMEKAVVAFNDHQVIRVVKKNGQLVGPGHIMIMYGEVAFRMQLISVNESCFIRMEEISEILTE
jgi:hypothetical protein